MEYTLKDFPFFEPISPFQPFQGAALGKPMVRNVESYLLFFRNQINLSTFAGDIKDGAHTSRLGLCDDAVQMRHNNFVYS